MSLNEIEIPQPAPQTSGAFSEDGKSGRVTTSLSFSGGTATGPGFSADYTLSVPAGNVYEISVSADDTATVSGGDDFCGRGLGKRLRKPRSHRFRCVEKLAGGAEISYDPSGNFASVKSPDGVVLSASQLGVEVIRDEDGALRQIWSLADGNLASETLLGGGKTHLLTELYDAFGRSLGYTYSKDGSVQQTVGTSYDAASGRIATASFLHGGAAKTFSYNYLAGTPLLASLACPSNLTIEHAYEAGRDLVAGITIRRGAGTNVVLRNYTYDTLDRPLTRSTSRNGTTQNDTFGYNSRSELVSATLGNDNYSYAFDAIGNRETSSEAGTALTYTANNLNQYTEICSAEPIQQTATPSAQLSALQLLYDADGNATQIQTSTGTWTISYNAENRPIRFENAGTQTVVECGYDSQGRRFEKKVTAAGTTMLHHRYIYRGYLQIAALDLTRAAHPALWLVTWDPTQPTATRPLALQKDGTWFTYGYDITKNVCELFGPNGYIRTTYSYTPFGSVSASENGVVQNFQWSSEFYDSELDLVYYNYRHYSPSLGRFLSRDPIAEQGGLNLYTFVGNNPCFRNDVLGKSSVLGNIGNWIVSTSENLLWGACCGNKKYDTRTHCCLNSKGKKQLFGNSGCRIYSREQVTTKVTRKDLYGRMGLDWVLKHSWITYPGGSAGFYPAGGKTTALYAGEVVIPEPMEKDFGTIADSDPVVLDSCEYDIEKFERCISVEAEKAQKDPDIYFVLTNNCQQWRGVLISICMEIAKR